MAPQWRRTELSAKIVYGHVLKTTQHSVHVQNHVSLEWDSKYLIMIVSATTISY